MRYLLSTFLGIVSLLTSGSVAQFVFPIISTGATVTIGALSGTAGLGATAAAAAGVAGLGLAALAFNRDRGTGYYDRRGYNRRQSIFSAPLPISRSVNHRIQRSVAVEDVFQRVAHIDVMGCGLKMVCAIYATPENRLNSEERAIKTMIGPNPQPVEPEDAREPKAAYISAAIVGGQQNGCDEVYNYCPLSREEMSRQLNHLDLEY